MQIEFYKRGCNFSQSMMATGCNSMSRYICKFVQLEDFLTFSKSRQLAVIELIHIRLR